MTENTIIDIEAGTDADDMEITEYTSESSADAVAGEPARRPSA